MSFISNEIIRIIYLPVILLTAALFVLTLANDRRRPIVRTFLFILAMLLFFDIAIISYHITKSSFVARYLYDLKLPFVTFSSMGILIFTLQFYKRKWKLSRKWLIMLGLIPAVTGILCITSPWHGLVRSYLTVDTEGTLHTAVNQRGIWFWVHSAYCYVVAVTCQGISLAQQRKQKKGMRASSSYLILGLLMSICFNIFPLLNILYIPFDITPIGMCVTSLFFYIVIITSEKTSFLVHARDEVFNFMDDYILILDGNRYIIDVNRTARAWLDGMGLAKVHEFSAVLDALMERGAEFRETEESGGAGKDIRFSGNGHNIILNMTERTVYDDDGDALGEFITFSDVTGSRSLIERLSGIAGIDALTGLQNRHGLSEARLKLDRPENLPVSIIFGDMNGLKEVNDRLGHKQGDNMLAHAAAILNQACPENGRVFRVGGDEFVMLIPKCAGKQAMEVILDVNARMSNISGYPYRLSMAMGYAVKETEDQDLTVLIDEADHKMYSFKRKSQAERKSGHAVSVGREPE